MRQVFLAGEEAHKGAPLLGDMIPNGPLQRRVAGLKGVEDRPLRHRRRHVPLHVAADSRDGSQMGRKRYRDHFFIAHNAHFQAVRSCECLDLDGKHRREIANDGRPAIAGIGRCIDLAAGGAEIHAAGIE